MSIRALKQYVELYHLNGISDFFIESKEFKVDIVLKRIGDIEDSSKIITPPKTPTKRVTIESIAPTKVEIYEVKSLDSNVLKQKYASCQNCSLHTSRVKLVYGAGNPKADIMVIGDPPNSVENMSGYPFVGEMGKLFDSMMNAIQLNRKDMYLTNIVKCRYSKEDGKYRITEFDTEKLMSCLPFLIQQIDLLKPKFILLMGEIVANVIFNKKENIDTLRQNQGEFFLDIPVYITYNVSELYEKPHLKKLAWADLQTFQKAMS